MNKDYSSLMAPEIIALLEEPTDDRRPLKRKLRYEARVKELIKALQLSRLELTRCILCDILADRRAKTAIDALVECLDDPSVDVRNYAAEALAKIGSQKSGKALLEHFMKDHQVWYAIALGAIKYKPSIPYLIDALRSPVPKVRGGAAWSLGYLNVEEAHDALEQALILETDGYSISRIKGALEELSK